MKALILVVVLYSFALSQENSRWGKAELLYEKPISSSKRDYTIKGENSVERIVNGGIKLYWFMISDVDGDNCPFHPTCSSFLSESVKQTNIFTGTLMFADRFTRDMNFYKRESRYARVKGGKLYDPPEQYLINQRFRYIPPSLIINQ
jgi:putative component of membrane protein insertase Oxa1/YidC/SpoIIIJ protein YidD